MTRRIAKQTRARSKPRPSLYQFWPLVVFVAALLGFAAWIGWQTLGPQSQVDVTVYRSPGCQCCLAWVARLEAAGFTVRVWNDPDLDATRVRLGVPAKMAGCHTAITREGYVIEGHVPPEDLKRLVTERLRLRGLAVPGMPVGSPGMEGPNPEPYDVWALPLEGEPTLFSHRGPAPATAP